jgi:hypothetical protein
MMALLEGDMARAKLLRAQGAPASRSSSMPVPMLRRRRLVARHLSEQKRERSSCVFSMPAPIRQT